MATVQPKGDNIRNAVKWISEQRQSEDPPGNRKLVEQASIQFNLTPKDTEYLERFLAGDEQET